jgi:hypothetical protein
MAREEGRSHRALEGEARPADGAVVAFVVAGELFLQHRDTATVTWEIGLPGERPPRSRDQNITRHSRSGAAYATTLASVYVRLSSSRER